MWSPRNRKEEGLEAGPAGSNRERRGSRQELGQAGGGGGGPAGRLAAGGKRPVALGSLEPLWRDEHKPDLSASALKVVKEQRQPDGQFCAEVWCRGGRRPIRAGSV